MLIYLTFLHCSFVLWLFLLHITTAKKTQILCYCLLNDRLEGTWETKGKKKPMKTSTQVVFHISLCLFKETKEERKMFCFICSSADIFNMNTPREAQVNQVTAMGVVSAGHFGGVIPKCCPNNPN